MATQLVDSPTAEPPPGDPSAAGESPGPATPQAAPGTAQCAKCGAQLAAGQDWCLQCGAGAPGSVAGHPWKGPAAIVAVTLALVLGAAAAGYAALSKKGQQAPVVTTTVAQAPPPAATTTPAVTTPAAPLGGATAKPPKIPLKAVTPIPAPATPAPTPAPTVPSTTKTGTTTNGTSGAGSSEKAEEPKTEAILLDTNAASTYNPYGYPAEWFGDPTLAIDGDTTTGWTAEVNPATAPKMAEGIAIDLKSTRHLAAVKLVTSTPGLTVQVYGTASSKVPSSITDPAWVSLSRSIVVGKRHARIGLRNHKKSYRFVALWVSRAPESAAGTPEAPGKIAIDELELIPTA